MHMSTLIYGLAATSLTMAQRSPDPGDIPDLKTEGPFALRVKGHDKASSIDGEKNLITFSLILGERRN